MAYTPPGGGSVGLDFVGPALPPNGGDVNLEFDVVKPSMALNNASTRWSIAG